MGSFDVACSISGITISCGDPVVYFPLKGNKYSDERQGRFLIYPNCLYEPVCLPVFGEYDDYGDVKITRDKNVSIIEEHFGMAIEKIVNNEDPGMPEPVTGGMFVHREIYDHLINNHSDENGKDEKDIFGFDGKTLDKIYDDSVVIINTAKRAAAKFCKLFPDGLQPDLRWTETCGDCSIFTYGTDYVDFRKLYYNSVEKGELKKELCDFWRFHVAMNGSNKFYGPAMNGYQCGNHYQARILAKKTIEILNKKIEESDSW